MKEVFKKLIVRDVEILVSNLGNVIKNGKYANKRENPDGYLVVSINNRSIGIHRLVAMAFIENDNPLRNEVNHIDFNRQNNSVENLEWLTHAENIQHSKKHGRYAKRYGEDNSNYGNRKLSKFYKENPEISKQKQGRVGSRNGKATPIELYKDGIFIRKFPYIGECCEFLCENYGFSSNYEITRCGIRRSISKNVPYKGFTFIKQ